MEHQFTQAKPEPRKVPESPVPARLRITAAPASQQGLALITVLFMVVILSLVVVGSLNLSSLSFTAAANTNESASAEASAQSVAEQVMGQSGAPWVDNPTAMSATPVSVDTNGDGVADFSVTRTATCISRRAVPLDELNTTLDSDVACTKGGTAENAGIVTTGSASTSTDSLCSDTAWNLTVTATSTRSSSGARAVINQGVNIRMSADNASLFCS